MFVNFIGALVLSIAGFFYVKNRKKSSFVIHFIPTLQAGKYQGGKEAGFQSISNKKTKGRISKRAQRDVAKRDRSIKMAMAKAEHEKNKTHKDQKEPKL